MINFFDKQASSEFVSDLNREIDKYKYFRSKLYTPDEDPSGEFHKLCKDILEVSDVNYELREKFGDYLLGKEFQKALYLNVGKFLGYNEKEIEKKKY